MKEGLYFKQLAIGDMANYVYLIGDQAERKAVVVDPAWDIDAILEQLDKDDMELVGALATHYHPDHIGGDMMGLSIEGLDTLLEKRPVKIYIHKAEAPYVAQTTGLESSDYVAVDGETTLDVGKIPVRFLHTPGHTPGSQCFLVDGNVVSGDTLFIGACGRVDLPGSNPEDLYYSLKQKLSALPDDTVVYPGHNYATDSSSTIGAEKKSNVFMRFENLQQFLSMMGVAG
ncbi:MAG TPA: MBL fold metallo-hydrolase [Deltaproteobacteria bacterium]|nr:MBL fold metallo-hydrolase [Candidatus Binatota bacterium]HIL12420.1 MBL fold metallo-hydrolase [Deltaproteobacteria bacterium]